MIFIQPSISPIILSIGFLDIRWYSLAYIFAFILGSILIKKLNKKSHYLISDKQIDNFFIWAVIGVIVGGRIGYVLFYQTKLFFLNEGTDGLDIGYDAGAMDFGNNLLYSRLVSDDEGINMVIQTLNFDEVNDKVIPLGINAEAEEEAIISISHNTTNPSTYVYLEDALEGTFTNLKETDFVITPDSNLQGIGRFFIHTSASTMSNEDATTNLLNVYKLDRNNFITVEGLSTQSNQTNLKLYNILGKEVLSTTLANNTNTQTISTEGLSTGIYVIKLESGNDLLTKKLIIK